MKKLLIIVLGIGLIFPVLNAESKVSDQEMMKKWQAFATPGAMHKHLAKSVGKWKNQSKMWMKPGAPPQSSSGYSEGKMILGGRYLKMKFKGQSLGMPFEGISIAGYDNFKKKFLLYYPYKIL